MYIRMQDNKIHGEKQGRITHACKIISKNKYLDIFEPELVINFIERIIRSAGVPVVLFEGFDSNAPIILCPLFTFPER